MMNRLVALFFISLASQHLLVQAIEEHHFQLSPNVEYLIPVDFPSSGYSPDSNKNTHTFKVKINDEGNCLVFLDVFDFQRKNADITAARELKQLRKYAVKVARDFCRGYSVIFKNINKSDEQLDFSSYLETNEIEVSGKTRGLVRHRRAASTTVFKALPRGRYRGQTQSQYLNFGEQSTPGKAEAESTQDGSRASVSGTNGMGQAQSQSGFSSGCDGCYENPDGTQSQTILAGGISGRYPSTNAGQNFRTPQGQDKTGTDIGYGESRPYYKDPRYPIGPGSGPVDNISRLPDVYNKNTEQQTKPGTYPQGQPENFWNPNGQRGDSYGDNDKARPTGSIRYPDQYPNTGSDRYPNQYTDTPGPAGTYPSGGRDSFGGNGKVAPTGSDRDPNQYPDTTGSTATYPSGGRDSFGGNGKVPPVGSDRYPNQYPDTTGPAGPYPSGGRDSFGGNGKVPPSGSDRYPNQYPDTPGSTGTYPSGGRDSFSGNGKVPPVGSDGYPNRYPDTPGSTGTYPSGGRDSFGGNGKVPPSGSDRYPNQYPDTPGSTGTYPSGGRDSFGGHGKVPPVGSDRYPNQYPDKTGPAGPYPSGGRDSFGGNGKVPPAGSDRYPNQYPDTPGSTGTYPSGGRDSFGGNGKVPPAGSDRYPNQYPDTPGSTGTYPSGGRDSFGGHGKVPPVGSDRYPNQYPDKTGPAGPYPSGGRDSFGGNGKVPPAGSDRYPNQYPDTPGSTGTYPSGGRDSFGGNGKVPPAGSDRYPHQYPDTPGSTGTYPSGGRDSFGGNGKVPPVGSDRYPNQYPDTTGPAGPYPSGGRDSFGENGKVPPAGSDRYPNQYPDTTGPAGPYPSGGRDSFGGNGKVPPSGSDRYPNQYPDTPGSTSTYPSGGRDSFGGNGKVPPAGSDRYPNRYSDTPGSTGTYPSGGRDSFGGNGKVPSVGSDRYPNQYPDTPGSAGTYPSGGRDSFGGNGKIPPSGSDRYPNQYPDTSGSGGTYPSGGRDSFGGNDKIPPTDHGRYPNQYPDTTGPAGTYPSGGNGKIPPVGSDMYPNQYPDTTGSTGTYPSGGRDSYNVNGKIPPTGSGRYPNQYPDTPGSFGNNDYNQQNVGNYPSTSNDNLNRPGQGPTREQFYPDSQKPGSHSDQTRPIIGGHDPHGNYLNGQQQPEQNQFSSPSEYNRPDMTGYNPDNSYNGQRKPGYPEAGRQPSGRPDMSDIHGNSPKLPGQSLDSNIPGKYNPEKEYFGYPDNSNIHHDPQGPYSQRPGLNSDKTIGNRPGVHDQGDRYPAGYTQGSNVGPGGSQSGSYYPSYPGSQNGYPSYDSNSGRGYGNQFTGDIDDTNSQAETSIQQLHNETKASALSSGKQGGGTAQSQIIGSYTGSGSFSAQAQTIDANRGAQTQISVGGKGATSSAQGNAGYGQSQAQLQLGSENGATIAGAQSGGWNHGTNTQVEASSKGGMADAQANGPGSTSSQAQIGFQPYQEAKNREEDSKPGSPFYGGGTASAQSGNYAGQSQTQIQGKFKYGLSYNGAAQAGSGGKDNFLKNKTLIRPLVLFTPKPVIGEVKTTPQAQFSAMNTGTTLNEGMLESESKNVEQTHVESHDVQNSNSGVLSLNPTKKIRHSKVQSEPTYSDDKDPQIMDEYDNEEGDEDDDYDLDFYHSTEASQQKSQDINSPRDVVVQQSGHGQRQHIILGPLENNGAKVIQDSSQTGLLKEGMLFQPGEVIPGTQGYTIPIGFRGRVSSVSDGDDTFAYTDENGESQAQTITLTPGSGNITYSKPTTRAQPTVRSWVPSYEYVQGPSTNRRYMNRYNLKSNRNGYTPEEYVTVTKTVAGELDSDKNNLQNKKYAHTYYTKSSTCGYFTFSCNLVYGSNGRTKICKPKAPLNPDGTPVQC